MKTIFVPLDGSERAEQAVPLASLLARVTGASVELIRILRSANGHETTGSSVVAVSSAFVYLHELARRLPAEVERETKIVRGADATALLPRIGRDDDALIVMGTHWRGASGRVFLGNVADRMVRAGVAPVALVRDQRMTVPVGLESILVPLDGSRLAERAVPLAADLALRSGAVLRLFRYADIFQYEPWAGPGLGATDVARGMTDYLRAQAGEYLESVAAGLRQGGLNVTCHVRSVEGRSFGRSVTAGHHIVEAAKDAGAGLVVLSTHGHGGLRRWAYGSVATDLLRMSPVPVLVVPPSAPVPVLAERGHVAAAGIA